MDSEYYKGNYDKVGVSYYDLATDVLIDAGIDDYYLDPRLKNLYTKNPLPRVSHKEALQIIANACRCVLLQTRSGAVQIKSNFNPEVTVSTNDETEFSQVANILKEGKKDEYATLSENYTSVDGGMYFLPRNLTGNVLNTGYVSDAVSDENGSFETNPVLTFIQEAACMYKGVKFVFGQSLPSAITFRTYNNGTLVEEYEVTDDITQTTVINHDFDDFDKMEVVFTKTSVPHSRIVVNYFSFGDITDFTMTRTDMTSSPKAIKQELVKEVIVPCYSYQNGTQEESLISEDITVTNGHVETFFLGEPSHNFRATLDSSTSGVSIVSSGNYYVTLKFTKSGTFRLEIFGYRYKITERYANKILRSRGKTIKWENPLMSDMTMAMELAEWLGDHYSSGIEYEYNTRGNPEIDVNDIVYQENEFHKDMKVNIYRHTLNFNQSFSGKVTARRIGG
jgi:hypothetical protein